MCKCDEQIIAGMLRSLFKLGLISDFKFLDCLINELQIRLYAREMGISIKELYKK